MGERRDTTAPPLVIAHRGYSAVAPENTLAAFEAALRAGADVVETDLRPAADGQVVLVHDAEVDATTDGRGPVGGLTAADLARLDAGSWFSGAYRGQRLPLLADLLDLLAEHPGARLLLELKEVWTPEQVAAVLRQVHRARAADRVVLQSFELLTLRRVRDQAPRVRLAVLVDDLPADAAARARVLRRDLGVVACNPGAAALVTRPGLVADLHGAGLQVWPWTLDAPALWEHVVGLGVDGVITNRPDGLRGWLEARRARDERSADPSALLLTALAQRSRADGARCPVPVPVPALRSA
ncbi:glycerophosphodiester phosphodiesterase [Kineococcus terrestris]|uniref:glycerophosphodiester phosphodiesterase n=1 Tax=Kineococcus terrestris TaxID=2044856 RepID=UPI0034DB7C60